MLCTNMMQFNCYNYFLPIQHFLCNLDHSIQVCGLMPPKMTCQKPTSQILVTCLLGWITVKFSTLWWILGVGWAFLSCWISYETRECFTMWPCHLHLNSIWRQKKNYGNSNTSSCKTIIIKKSSPKKKTKILQDIIITLW
jgi:hypothetical protein